MLHGWTIAGPRQGGGFRFEPRMHDPGEKIVLGHKIKAGGGRDDGEKVLDILARHPSTARFISTKLVRRFVSDTPPPALVDRAAARFQATDGNIREVLRTILTSPEFFAADAYRAKIKTPFEFVVSAVRATGTDVSTALPLVQTVRQLGMPLVFLSAAHRLRRSRGRLGQHRRAAQPHELRARARERPDEGLRLRGSSTDRAPRGSLVVSALASDISPATASTLAKASDAAQVDRAHAGVAGIPAKIGSSDACCPDAYS